MKLYLYSFNEFQGNNIKQEVIEVNEKSKTYNCENLNICFKTVFKKSEINVLSDSYKMFSDSENLSLFKKLLIERLNENIIGFEKKIENEMKYISYIEKQE